MQDETIQDQLAAYAAYLDQEEKSEMTKKQYQRDVRCFLQFVSGKPITKERVIAYKEKLQRQYRPTSVNAKLAAINGFFSFTGKNELKVKQLKIQRKPYCTQKRELSKEEYVRLIEAAARQQNPKLSLLIQTICGTGIRVSELCFITAEAVRCGEATISMKGKTRTILLADKLCSVLKKYMEQRAIKTGPVFVTRNGNPLDRSNIWKMMKVLCRSANVDMDKVFPHNLRHLFARCFYSANKDIAKLADILGHSHIDTTRIYIISSGQEHRRCMDALGLVI